MLSRGSHALAGGNNRPGSIVYMLLHPMRRVYCFGSAQQHLYWSLIIIAIAVIAQAIAASQWQTIPATPTRSSVGHKSFLDPNDTRFRCSQLAATSGATRRAAMNGSAPSEVRIAAADLARRRRIERAQAEIDSHKLRSKVAQSKQRQQQDAIKYSGRPARTTRRESVLCVS